MRFVATTLAVSALAFSLSCARAFAIDERIADPQAMAALMAKADQAQSGRGMITIAGVQLLAGQLSHLVNQLGVEKTLFFGLGLVGLGHERGHSLRIGNSFIYGEGADAGKAEG